ncbi:GIY-YIG nuclease family protein [Thiothrix sp.]|jgi:hypothetical protein|uniref:GIY-YIG nuclease family protein n=1 Tax=Thiothrix sp. TaxID=1032 RepID=UPI00257A7A48|nr:GIY-YIG nuclease family protein [Thiothrix sp.]
MKGWVYIITNDAMPDLIKIGYSRKDPYERAKELNHTGAPLPFKVEYEVLVENPYLIEQKAHQKLHNKRVGKEWFRCSVHEGASVIDCLTEDAALYRNTDYSVDANVLMLDMSVFNFSLVPPSNEWRNRKVGQEFNDFMCLYREKAVNLSITMPSDMITQRERDEYDRLIFTVSNIDNDIWSGGCEYLIHLPMQYKNPFYFNGNIVSLSGCFEVFDINGPRQGYMSVNLRSVTDLSNKQKVIDFNIGILEAILNLHDYYGDVPSAINCSKFKSKAEKIICSDVILRMMELLDSMSYVYAEENRIKSEVDHDNFYPLWWIENVRDKCSDAESLYAAFKQHTDKSLGGMSPYCHAIDKKIKDIDSDNGIYFNIINFFNKFLELRDECGDVPSAVKSWSLTSKAEEIIYSSTLLRAMELLDSMAYVFSAEKNSRVKVNHKEFRDDFWIRNIRNKCDDVSSLYRAFVDHTRKSLGKYSPYDNF